MYILNEVLLKQGDEVICPSCRKTVFVNKEIPIIDAKKLGRCGRCGAYVRYGNLQKVSSTKEENNG